MARSIQHRVLLIPAETFPTHQSFLSEVYSKEDRNVQSIFLMKSTDCAKRLCPQKWNMAKVYLFPYQQKYKFLKSLNTYFFIDLRYIYLIPYIVVKDKISIIQIRDSTFPFLIALVLKLILDKKVIYQKSFPHECRKTDPKFTLKYKLPRLLQFTAKYENKTLHFMMKFCDAILPISKYMGKDLENDYGLPAEKIHPFGMGFNFTSPLPQQSIPELPQDNLFLLIYIGAYEGRELDLLIQGLARAIKANPHCAIHTDFYGGEPEEIDELQQVAEQCDIVQYCHIKGRIERSEIYKKVLDSHIGLAWVGSDIRYTIASPTKTIEYLSLGIPIIATDSVYLQKNLIKDTNAGVCCAVDPEDFARQLATLMQNYKKYKLNAQHSKTYMESNYSYAAIRDRAIELYDSLY